MPIERNSSTKQVSTIVMMMAATAVVVLLVFLLIRAASGSGGVSLKLGDNRFDAGNAKERAASIARSGPLLFSDVSGGGQNRPMFLNHLGNDPRTGWVAVDARPPGAKRGCFLVWSRTTKQFHPKSACAPGIFPADGTGLVSYPWKYTEAETVEIDLRDAVQPGAVTTTTVR